MHKPRKQPNQYTVKRDRSAAKSSKDKEAEPAEKQPLPSVAELNAKRDELSKTVVKIEKQILVLEDRYVEQSSPLGNAVTGYEGLLSGNVVLHQDMRLFTGSSATGARPPAATSPTANAPAVAPAAAPAAQPAVPPPQST